MSIRPLATDTSDILLNTYDSNLKQPSYSGDGTIQLYSISNLAVDQILLIGELGDEGSEIIKTHHTTAPSGSTITLASTLVKDHPADVKVYVILFDQIEFSNAATLGGSKTILNTLQIDPESNQTVITDSVSSGGLYFTRYKNSITSLFSDYSDPIPYEGLASNTVGSLIEAAMSDSQKEFTKKLTYESLTREINECLRFVRGKLKKWSSSEVFDYVMGQANRGIYRLPLPTNYYDQNSNKSILNVRVGAGSLFSAQLNYIDKIEFNQMLEGTCHSTVVSQTSSGSTTLVLANSGDFNPSGTINVYVNNVLMTITYTANNTTTNTLSGIPASGTGSITTTIPSSTDVWFGEVEGIPENFTVFGGFLYFYFLAGPDVTSRNVYLDYYSDIVEVNSPGDIIPLARFDMIKHWLMWVIKAATEKNGQKSFNDPEFQLFNVCLQDAVRRETTGQKYKMKPKVNEIRYKTGGSYQSYNDYQRS